MHFVHGACHVSYVMFLCVAYRASYVVHCESWIVSHAVCIAWHILCAVLHNVSRVVYSLPRDMRPAHVPYVVRGMFQATITVEALHDGVDFSLPLTRAKFEELNQDLFKKTLDVSFRAFEFGDFW